MKALWACGLWGMQHCRASLGPPKGIPLHSPRAPSCRAWGLGAPGNARGGISWVWGGGGSGEGCGGHPCSVLRQGCGLAGSGRAALRQAAPEDTAEDSDPLTG